MLVERTQREKLLRKVSRLVEEKYFNRISTFRSGET